MAQDPKRQRVDMSRLACIDAIGSSLFSAKEAIIRDFGDNIHKIEVEVCVLNRS